MSSSSNSQAVLYIPADRLEFPVAEIPTMLAEARWPHVQGQCVAYALRLDAPLTRGKVLTAQDMDTLNVIWREANLPEPDFPISVGDWQRYVDAFNSSARRPDWDLWQCLQSSGYDNGMRRAAAQSGYESSLREAIRSGEISARDPLIGRPVPPSDVRAQFNPDHLVLSRDDLVRFASSSLIEIQVSAREGEQRVGVSSMDTCPAATGDLCHVEPGSREPDRIGREIEIAIAEIQKRDTHASVNAAAVMEELIRRRGDAASCITDVADGATGVLWLNQDGEIRKLLIGNLKDRLKRRKKRMSKSDPKGR